MILTQRDLKLLRAALLYWQQEMSPHGAECAAPYFDGPVADNGLSGEKAEDLRQQLGRCELRYGRCSADHTEMVDHRLCNSLEEAAQTHSMEQLIVATVLVKVELGR